MSIIVTEQIITDRFRLVITKDHRKKIGLKVGDEVVITTSHNQIIIKPKEKLTNVK